MPASGRKSSASKKGKKAGKKAASGDKKKKAGKARKVSYSRYIHKLIPKGKKGRASIAVTTKGMAILNSFVLDMFDRLAGEACRLATHAGAKTLSSKAVLTAVKLRLPKDLADHALKAAQNALEKYTGGKKVSKKKK